MTDKQLLDRFTSERDEVAFEGIVRRHGPVVLRICRGILDDPHEVEDAFQGAFVVLVRNAESIRDRDSLGPWLYEVAYRVATRARGRNARRRAEIGGQAVVAISLAESAPGPDPEHRELVSLLHAEVDRLPEGCRAAIVSCYLEGRTHEEAARGLGLPLGTLKGRLRQGRELLRTRLARRGVAVSLALILLLLKESKCRAEVVVSERLVRSTVDAALAALGKKLATRALLAPVALAAATLIVSTTVGPFLSGGRLSASALGLLGPPPVRQPDRALRACSDEAEDGIVGPGLILPPSVAVLHAKPAPAPPPMPKAKAKAKAKPKDDKPVKPKDVPPAKS